jgi:arylsulfatase A-like enzyme
MTGLYPHEHRVGRAPDSPSEFGSLPVERTTIAEVFQNAQYQTMAVVNNTFLAPDFGLAQGFDTFDYRGADNQDIRSAEDSTDVALDWWSQTEGPKFLFWHVMEPHMDLLPPEETRGTFVSNPSVKIPFDVKQGAEITGQSPAERDVQQISDVLSLYDEEILAVDQQLGRLVDSIGMENTIFVFTSDHGEEFWEHNDFEHGHHLKSVLTHIPLIFWGDGVSVGRQRTLVSHVDMFRTILELAKLPHPIDTHGEMLLGEPLAAGRMVLSENTLYGDPLLSVVSETHRLEINQETKMAALWTMGSSGKEAELLRDDLDTLAEPMFNYIRAVRGNVDVIEQVSGPSVPSRDAFQNLKKLGYIDSER